MWENETKKETQPYQPQHLAKKSPKNTKDTLLAVQCAICMAIVAFVLFLRSAMPETLPELRTEYEQMLTQGVDFAGDTPLLRFVNGTVETARAAMSDWVENLSAPQAVGGFWPAVGSAVPQGASTKKYTLEETLLTPIEGGTLTSGFGFRKNPLSKGRDFHLGIDLAAAQGTDVRACLAGQVVQAGYSAMRGNYIIIRHRAGLATLYQHLQCGFVRAGESVKTGERIGLVGQTGYVTGAHLHLELLVDGLRVDPLPQFPAFAA